MRAIFITKNAIYSTAVMVLMSIIAIGLTACGGGGGGNTPKPKPGTPSISVAAQPQVLADNDTVTFTVTGKNLTASTTVTASGFDDSLVATPNPCSLSEGSSSCIITATSKYAESSSISKTIIFTAPGIAVQNSPLNITLKNLYSNLNIAYSELLPLDLNCYTETNMPVLTPILLLKLL